MTIEEARAIGRILRTADGGCESCAGALFSAIAYEFPAFAWVFQGEAVDPEPVVLLNEYEDWSVSELPGTVTTQ